MIGNFSRHLTRIESRGLHHLAKVFMNPVSSESRPVPESEAVSTPIRRGSFGVRAGFGYASNPSFPTDSGSGTEVFSGFMPAQLQLEASYRPLPFLTLRLHGGLGTFFPPSRPLILRSDSMGGITESSDGSVFDINAGPIGGLELAFGNSDFFWPFVDVSVSSNSYRYTPGRFATSLAGSQGTAIGFSADAGIRIEGDRLPIGIEIAFRLQYLDFSGTSSVGAGAVVNVLGRFFRF